MKYVYMIYLSEQKLADLPADELDQVQKEAGAQVEELESGGHLVAALGLEPVASAATLRVRNGDLSVTDGPFAETNEQLGGLAIIEAADLNEAIRIAAKDPAARHGSIEVRRIAGGTLD
jgi:hypothetical protein